MCRQSALIAEKNYALINDTMCRECRMDGVRTDVSILFREYDEYELVGDATTMLNNYVAGTMFNYGYEDGYFRIILPKPIWEMSERQKRIISETVDMEIVKRGVKNVIITYDRRNND